MYILYRPSSLAESEFKAESVTLNVFSQKQGGEFYFLTVIQFQVCASFVVAHNVSDVGSNLEISPLDFVFHSNNLSAGILHIRHDHILSFTHLLLIFCVFIHLSSRPHVVDASEFASTEIHRRIFHIIIFTKISRLWPIKFMRGLVFDSEDGQTVTCYEDGTDFFRNLEGIPEKKNMNVNVLRAGRFLQNCAENCVYAVVNFFYIGLYNPNVLSCSQQETLL